MHTRAAVRSMGSLALRPILCPGWIVFLTLGLGETRPSTPVVVASLGVSAVASAGLLLVPRPA